MADDQSAADVERRLNAGEWLHLSDLAVLFDVDRTTVHRWIRRHELIRVRPQSPVGGTSPLECNPEDVAKLLAQHRARKAAAG